MNILILGGSGFIGSRVAKILRERQHSVTTPSHAELDLMRLDLDAAQRLLHGQDCVVNCIGVMSRHAAVLEQVHHHAPQQLAHLARAVGVQTWVQLSALGADAAHDVAFVGSKGRGDAAVCASSLRVNIARPSVVFGRGGASCELFIKLARLPVLVLPAGGRFDVQPVHANDVAQGLAAMAEQPLPHGAVVNMTGSLKTTLAEYLAILRQTLHHRAAPAVWALPMGLLRPALPLTNILSNGFLSQGSLKLLAQGSVADTGILRGCWGVSRWGRGSFIGMRERAGLRGKNTRVC